jgi:YggT family protein
LQTIEVLLFLYINGFSIAPTSISIGGLLIWSCGELLDLFLVFIFFTTLIQVVASWIQPDRYNPAIILFARITEPFLSPLRRILPDFGVLDFSPLVLIFLIYLLRILVANPLIAVGRHLI